MIFFIKQVVNSSIANCVGGSASFPVNSLFQVRQKTIPLAAFMQVGNRQSKQAMQAFHAFQLPGSSLE
jgi:hypothetical protein